MQFVISFLIDADHQIYGKCLYLKLRKSECRCLTPVSFINLQICELLGGVDHHHHCNICYRQTSYRVFVHSSAQSKAILGILHSRLHFPQERSTQEPWLQGQVPRYRKETSSLAASLHVSMHIYIYILPPIKTINLDQIVR